MMSNYHVLLPESAEDHEVWDRKRINKKKHLLIKVVPYIGLPW